MHRFFFLLVLVGLAGARVRAEQLTVVAEQGDGIYSLLRRYKLVEYPCNITEFRRLNDLKVNANLLRGETYRLPIELFEYNGKSIRSTTGNDHYARALAIQKYNEMLLTEKIREEDFRQDKQLFVPYHIDNCPLAAKAEKPAEILQSGEVETNGQPTTSAYRTFDIFGPEHAKVPLVDRKLAGRIFYIVSGHGGPDPGAVGKRAGKQLYEDEYAYDVALRVTRNILRHGGTPYMIVRDNDGIRDTEYLAGDKDETVWGGTAIPRGQKDRLGQRSAIVNALYEENLGKGITDQTMISIHVDSRKNDRRIDLFFYYYEGDLIGAKRAENIRNTIGEKYQQYRPGRGYEGTVKPRDLFVLRETKPSGVYIELANITNVSDQQRILKPANRQLLADWIVLGLMKQ